MKTIRFIGAYDKTDMLINLAKILVMLDNRVLIVDSTASQKARYVVPSINPAVSYITSFEDIDIAVGFKSLEQIKSYSGVLENLGYDILLVDCDSSKRLDEFKFENVVDNYFVTSFDVYSLKRGMEILRDVNQTITLTKILFAKEVLKEEDDYLNFLSIGYNVDWNEDRIYFPIENGDLSVIAENQRVQKIKFRRLSVQYKDSLSYIAGRILGPNSEGNIRRVIKNIERGA